MLDMLESKGYEFSNGYDAREPIIPPPMLMGDLSE
jgi:hypothetical protein